MELLLFIFTTPGIFIFIDFLVFLIAGYRIVGDLFSKIFELIIMLGLPFLYLSVMDSGKVNDCCNNSAFFSPQHRLSAYCFIVSCLTAYFY